MILDKEVEVGIGRSKQYYLDKGYIFPTYINKNGIECTKRGTKIKVKVHDLPDNSNVIVNVKCDICGCVYNTTYQSAIRSQHDGKNYCKKCCREIFKETMINRYGVKNPSQLEDVKIKKEKTTFSNYGVTNPFQSQVIKEKIKSTNIEKYGVENPALSTNVREKMAKQMYKNQTQMCSSQQLYLAELYGCVINYPFKRYSLDLFDESNNINIEYDGGAHNLSVKLGNISQEEFDRREMIREKTIRSSGIKLVRLISPHDKLPSDDKLYEIYNFAKEYFKTGHTWINFYLEENKYRNTEHRNESGAFYDFGNLWNAKTLSKKKEVNDVA